MYMEEFTNKTNLYKAKGFRTTHPLIYWVVHTLKIFMISCFVTTPITFPISNTRTAGFFSSIVETVLASVVGEIAGKESPMMFRTRRCDTFLRSWSVIERTI